MAAITHHDIRDLQGPRSAPAVLAPWSTVAAAVSRGANRLLDGIYRSRQKHAEREIERYFADRNVRMTDAQERELSNRLIWGGSRANWR